MRPFIFGAVFRNGGKRVLKIENISGDGFPWRRQVLYLPIVSFLYKYTKRFWAGYKFSVLPVLDVRIYFWVKPVIRQKQSSKFGVLKICMNAS